MSDNHPLSIILPVYKRHKFRLLLGITALLGVDFFQLFIPRLIKHGVDALADMTATSTLLIHIAGLIMLAALCMTVLRFFWRYLIIGFSRILERDIRDRLFAHIFELDKAFFDRHTQGEIMAHSGNDLSAIQMACGMGTVAAVDALVISVAGLGCMFYINPMLTLVAILPMPFLAFTTKKLSGRLHDRFARVQEQFSILTEFARSSITGIRLIKVYTMEYLQERKFDKLGRDYIRNNLKVATIQGLLFPVAALVGNLGMLLVLYYGGRLAIASKITLGDFAAFMTYLTMLVWPMMAVGWVANLAQRGLTSLKRIQVLLDATSTLPDDDVTTNPQENFPKGVNYPPFVFTFRNLSFSYPGSEEEVLHNINLEIGPGILGVVGAQGSGKSTLCHLLARIYPVQDQTLFINQCDVNGLSPREIRANMSYVEQEAFLFSDTIAANISMGKPDATRKEIEEAATIAAIHDEILQLPDMYESRIGERGVNLSGGQRQRLALARCLLLKRPVMLIDDALSAVDMETERRIVTALSTYLQGKTVLFVSHRLSVLKDAGEIVILADGRVSDRGTHDELLKRSRYYTKIYDNQS